MTKEEFIEENLMGQLRGMSTRGRDVKMAADQLAEIWEKLQLLRKPKEITTPSEPFDLIPLVKKAQSKTTVKKKKK